MEKRDLLTLRKRFKSETATIDHVSGCLVNASKNKLLTFHDSFQTLPEDVIEKYLEIVKKSLSGSLNNHLLQYEFPTDEEQSGGSQAELLAIRDNFDATLLDAYFDKIIQTYEHEDNYLILAFHDSCDIITKRSDDSDEDSENVYQYVIFAICPVGPDKPALVFDSDSDMISVRSCSLTISTPEMAMLFPVISEDEVDIHSCLIYNKKPNKAHDEFVSGCLNMDPIKSASQIREEFYDIIKSNFDDEEQAEKAILSATRDIHDTIKSQFEDGDRIVEISASDIAEIIADDKRFAKDICESISNDYKEKFDGVLQSDILIDEGMLKKNRENIHILELEDVIADLSGSGDADNHVRIMAPKHVSDNLDIMDVNGKRCVCIPIDEGRVLMNGESVE